MRLSDRERDDIVQTVKRHFGALSRVWLFGSRVDDRARGGDIDIYVEPEVQEPDQIVDAQLDALVELKQRLGDQKIDLVVHRRAAKELPVHRLARETGVRL
ncbi:nucleotidyltransferase domain-containing protein [Halomonas sp. BM-2019]|jgi:predicted nucleotidyltransferase|uniref:nucleotidyltransferase domain-containing protein n=1 Tax=Halomonas sp. BM-2019 TaxID=2811227 RepID=UPI001B3C49A5|nr:MAG: nucleotidyltransferase domain-containing protein [Halomonas sp. BM-2019]